MATVWLRRATTREGTITTPKKVQEILTKGGTIQVGSGIAHMFGHDCGREECRCNNVRDPFHGLEITWTIVDRHSPQPGDTIVMVTEDGGFRIQALAA